MAEALLGGQHGQACGQGIKVACATNLTAAPVWAITLIAKKGNLPLDLNDLVDLFEQLFVRQHVSG